uniref:Uncharacterized protein n=1 Tax=Eucampia antarctica TaxID=49252 RepID=A0A7S2WBJ4_9STRA|mmetsp:Transcript_2573/g.2445  ORF Transcript_2573/g.2445 Transcript_2573/m.2445 type:complete len:123 (+) Transcript_2573:585-953(+)
MLKQKELYFLNWRLRKIINSDLVFGGLVVVLADVPVQFPAVKRNWLWYDKPKNASPYQFGKYLYTMFSASMKLTKNTRIDFIDPGAVRYELFSKRLRDGKNTMDDWKYIRNIGSKDSISSDA